MRCKKWVVSCLFYVVVAAMAAAQAQVPKQGVAQSNQQSTPDLKSIVQHVEQAAQENRERYRPYIITRDYRMYAGKGDQQKPNSEVLADVSFIPPSTKDFKILETKGSSRGETVVSHILENEQKAAATGQAPGAVSSQNYNFTLLGEEVLDQRPCYVLGLEPKRKDSNVIVGRAWVEKDNYLVKRVQGHLAKMPSWWVKSVELTLDFSDVSGMRLQTSTQASADVRIFGLHTLAENAVKIRTESTVAQTIPQRHTARRPFRSAEAVIGSFQH